MSERRIPFDRALATALEPGPAPEVLRCRLQAAAKRADQRRRTWLAFAAGIVLMLLSGSALALLLLAPSADARMAREALTHFMSAQQLDFHGTPPHPGRSSGAAAEDPCACWSQQVLGYAAALPEGVRSCAITGGRACRVGGRPAACYLLEEGRGLYVFEHPFRQGGEASGRPLVVAAGFQARAWNEGGRGYVMVEPRSK